MLTAKRMFPRKEKVNVSCLLSVQDCPDASPAESIRDSPRFGKANIKIFMKSSSQNSTSID